MCCDGIVDGLKSAKIAMQERNIQETNNELIKSQRLIRFLADSVDTRHGEPAKLLLSFYKFLLNHLIQANMEKDEKYIDEALSYLAKLREAWVEGFKPQPTRQPAPANIPPKSTHDATTRILDLQL